jgi:hypothetical protein
MSGGGGLVVVVVVAIVVETAKAVALLFVSVPGGSVLARALGVALPASAAVVVEIVTYVDG